VHTIASSDPIPSSVAVLARGVLTARD